MSEFTKNATGKDINPEEKKSLESELTNTDISGII
jgi:hypothetical protein